MSMHERRASPRLPVHGQVEVVVSDGRHAQAHCRIVDISPTGLRLEFMEPPDAGHFTDRTAVRIVQCGEPVQGMLLGKACRVSWRGGNAFGARFETPLEISLSELGMNAQFVPF